jgi:hypothetical protein
VVSPLTAGYLHPTCRPEPGLTVVAQVACLTLIAVDEPADALRLISCLRGDSNLRVGGLEDDRVQIIAHDVTDLYDQLDEQLDQCAEALEIRDRRQHLVVERPLA